MPARFSASERSERRKNAPRILKEPVSCRDSSFRRTGAPRIAESAGDSSSGVLRIRPARKARAFSMKARERGGSGAGVMNPTRVAGPILRNQQEPMAKWFFEPGHTAAEFRARHMMVSWVRGHFKDVHGTMDWDPANPGAAAVEVTIDARKLWSGEPDRDTHLKSADFLDVENHPTITFKSTGVELCGADRAKLAGDLTIRGITRPVTLDVRALGQ